MKKDVISIFIDFKKAFDTVDHEILLYKLEYYGIQGLVNDFFRSYLTNRRQYTVINGVNSDLRTISCGVPQGCFFLLYINDLYKSIGHNAVRLYADDTAIITSNSNFDIAQRQAREMFTKLYHWCVANKLSINSDKTHFVLFHMKNKPVPKKFTSIQTDVMQITCNIWECHSMKTYTGMTMSIRFAHHLWNTLGFLITSKTLFPCEYQYSSIMPSFILGYNTV